ncbi:MAG: ATP-binding protein [Ignavibacteriales bacterium]|nr:ATP-binding protein [Ignavibacteriales bacterium]
MRKIVEEVLSNALKFTEKGKRVEVSTSIEGNRSCIIVKDNGKGMTPEQVKRVGAYIQFDRSRQEQQGSGLGLALARKITNLYGGELAIESRLSVGTKVTVMIPRAD